MPRAEHITSTGWRVVGKAVSLVSDTTGVAPLPGGRYEDVLYTAKFQLRPLMGNGTAVHAALAALGNAIAVHWEDAPPLTRDLPVARAPGRFHGLHWETVGERDAWMGELLWRHPHPVVAGAPCTTHVLLIEQSGLTTLTVRVTADGGIQSVRGTVGAGQARPSFLTEMGKALRLVFDGDSCEPRTLHEEDVDDFVSDLLLSELREHPVAVLAPLEDGSHPVSPAEIAEEFLGLAHLFVIDRHPTTFRLTDSLGDKRLSCYWGALRVYMPGFSCADRPEEHPLLVRERVLDPVIRADLVGKLGRVARVRVQMPPGIADRRNAAAAAADISEAAAQRASAADAVREHAADSRSPTGPGFLESEVLSSGSVFSPDASSADGPDLANDSAPTHDPAFAHDSGYGSEQVSTTRPASAGGPDAAAMSSAQTQRAQMHPGAVSSGAAPSSPELRLLATSMPPLFANLGSQLGELASTISNLVAANAALADEIARLRTTTAVRAANTTSLERRIGGLEQLLSRHLEPVETDGTQPEGSEGGEGHEEYHDDDEVERTTLVDVLRQAATAHPDALLILDSAERAAADSPYTDVDRLAVILDAMAGLALRRQEGAMGTSLRVAFRELGIDYRGGISASTSERHRQQYVLRGPDGRSFDCREHIVLGSSYDPRHCLRVYFTSRAPVEPRFVIGHVGRHFDVISTT